MRRIVFVIFLTFAGFLTAPAQAQNNTISTVAGGGINPVTPASAYIPDVYDAVRDSAGNTYISAPTLNVVYKVSSAGTMTIYAGTGIFGDGGDGGPAIQAGLDFPEGLALDSTGNLFIADVQNDRIRRVDATSHLITTVAGSGLPFFPAYSGDGGPATSASLNFPRNVAVDMNGNLFIADTGNHAIRMVDNTAQHIITTYAGNGTAAVQGTANGDGGAATSAELSNPHGVALDAAGNLYIADETDSVVRKVDNTPAHIISTYAGNITLVNRFSGDGGPANQAGMSSPDGVFVDASGNLFIADTGNMVIRKVDTSPTHIITTVAGNRTACFDPSTGCGNGGAALSAGLNQPSSVTLDGAGNLIIADNGTQTVRVVSGGNISVFAGGASGGDNGPATSAILGLPNNVNIDSDGNLFILEQFGERVRKVDLSQTITTVAGTGAKGGLGFFGTTNTAPGPALKANFIAPFAMTLDSAGNIYVADARGLVIRKINTVTQQISTIAGNGNFCTAAPCGDGGAATSAEFQEPTGLALDSTGNLYISDASTSVIRVLNQTTGIITTFAGSYSLANCSGYNSGGSACGDGGPALSAALNQPFAVAVDSNGNLYVADAGDNAVRVINTSGMIGPYAFNGTPGFSGDGGDALSASMTEAQQLAFDPQNNLYIGGGLDNVVRRVDFATGSIITVAGNVENLGGGFSGDGGPSTQASIGNLGATLDANHNIYIADGAERVRKVHLVPVAAIDTTTFTGSFGSVLAGGQSVSQTITITNTGLDDLLITSSSAPADFLVQENSCLPNANEVPGSVPPGFGSCLLNVVFAPPAGVGPGTITGTLSFTTNDPATPTFTMAVSGTVGAVPGNTLSVTISPAATGSVAQVSSTPAGISCPGTCTANFAAGEVVALSAAPTVNTVLTAWSGAGCTGNSNCVVTMNGPESVTATFGNPTVTVNALGNGSGTISSNPAGISCTFNGTITGGICSAPIAGNQGNVTFTATPSPGSSFVGWMGFCSVTSGVGPCTVPVTSFGTSISLVAAVFSTAPQAFAKGQVFVGSSGGMIFVYSPAGTLVQVLGSGNLGGAIYGLTFDPTGNLYAANLEANTGQNNGNFGAVETFTPSGSGPGVFASGFTTAPASLVIDPSRDLFVSEIAGPQALLEFAQLENGAPTSTFSPPVDNGGVDWIELLDDNQTMLYTSASHDIKAFNIVDNTFVADYATNLPGRAAYAMRELPDKTLLVANSNGIIRLSPAGAVIQTYTPVVNGGFTDLNLDPNGTDFWTGNSVSGIVYEINIATAAIDHQFPTGLGFVSAGLGIFGGINGLAVFGQPASGGTDVAVTMTAAPNPVVENAPVTYTITVTNNGPLNAPAVVATDALAVGATFLSSSASQGTCSGTTTVTCNLGTLNNAASATITIVVTPTLDGILSNTVNITAGLPDSNTANNSATTSTTVNATANPAVLTITKTHTGNFAQGQQDATYAVAVSNGANAGPTNGTAVTVTETAPSGLALVTMAGTGWTCAANTCTRSDVLAAGASYPAIIVTVNVAANATSPQINAVSVAGGGSTGANASDSTTITTTTAGTITITPSNLAFASQAVNTMSAAQTVTLSNTGTVLVGLSGLSATPPFAIVSGADAGTCNSETDLAVEASCTVNVTFTPTTAGAASGTLSIADNAIGSPQAVALTGTGTGQVTPGPVPLVNRPLVPDSAAPGGAAFTLTVNGTGFVSGATIDWNGSPRTTNFVSGHQLTAAINAADISAARTASITVVNPGANTSNVVFFTVTNPAASVSFANAPGSPVTVGAGPFAVAVADFNGDGIQDLAVANDGASSVTILLGNGDGTFTAAAAPPGQFSGPSAIVVADFNGDGKLDLAVLNGGSNTVTILLGLGDGTFFVADVATPTTGSNPLSFVAGDFNGDGHVDLAVANYRSNTVTILLGNGDGSFAATEATPATGSFPAAIVAGDFNKDGKLDLAVDNQCGTGSCVTGTVTILLGDGTGNFTPTAVSPATGSGPVSMAVADFNGDGNLDLAVPSDCGSSGSCTSNGAVTILLGDGTGNFAASTSMAATGLRPYGVVVGDFNGDGKPDLAIANNDSNTVSILLGDGAGNFTPTATPPATGAGPVFPAVGDFNNDGLLDLVAANSGSNTITVLLAAGTTTAPTITIAPKALTFAAQALNTTSAAQSVTVSNAGNVAITFSNITTTGDFAGATLAQCPSLAVDSGPCTFQITFTPTAAGTRVGAVVFSDNATGGEQTVTLSGTGASTAGTVTLNPPSLTFASQAVNTTSPVQTVTVSNTGNVPVSLSGLGITGPFAIATGANAGTCNSETDLILEASCTINVAFMPTTTGNAAGALSVSDNATGSPQTVALSGTGGQAGVIITIPSGGSTTATTTPGGTAFYGLIITGAPGVTGTVQLGCIPSSNLITCQVIPSSVTLNGGTTQIAFGIQTFCQGATTTAASLPFNFRGNYGWPLVILAFVGMLWTLKRNRRLALTFAMLMLMTLGSAACASLPKGPNGATPAGTYSLTLTTTVNGQTQTLPNFLTLVVK